MPPTHQWGISQACQMWFSSVVSWIAGLEEGSLVYAAFSHAGLYIGKANVWRRDGMGSKLGYVERVVEHTIGMVLPYSRDGSFPRYRVLRSSLGSFCVLPLAKLPSPDRALACEKALIRSLRPNANGADWQGLLNTKSTGINLSPGKAIRARPPPPLRAPPDPGTSIWCQLHFAVAEKKLVKSVLDETPTLPKLPCGKLYRHL